MPKRNLVWVAVVVVIAAAFWKLPQTAARYDTLDKAFGALIAVRSQIARHYVETVDDRALVEGAVRGMLRELDPHSVYISPEDLAEFTKHAEGRFGGVGVALDLLQTEHGLQLIVISPMEGTPAFRAGVLAGDRILAIDGVSVESLAGSPELLVDEAVRRISGEPGTTVTLVLQQPGEARPRKVTVERAVIQVPSVTGWYRGSGRRWNFFIDGQAGIAYARIAHFVGDTPQEFKQIVDQLQEEGLRGLVLDLRDNSGGLLESAVDTADLFLESGPILSTRRLGQRLHEWRASLEGTFPDFPVVVLVNRLTASAAEIVAGALRDHGRSVLVGERTYGKGSVQNVYELPPPYEDARVKLTVAYYYLPGGQCIQRKGRGPDAEGGVVPDEIVELSPEELLQMRMNRQEAGILRGSSPPQDDDGSNTRGSAGPNGSEQIRPPPLDRQLERAVQILREQVPSLSTPRSASTLP